jgi:F0F1-type ATP synthase delta subunit
MNNKLQELVKQSYNNGQLDQEAVETIANHLDRKSLKEFLKLLKREEAKHEVFITSAQELSKTDRDKLQKLFAEKRLYYSIDTAMITGIKVIENDEEFEVNLNRTFHDIMMFLSRND